MSVLIPDKLHTDKYSSLHAYLKKGVKGGALKRLGKGLLGGTLSFAANVSMFNIKDPDSWINAFNGGNPEDAIGTVVKDWDSDTYLEVDQVIIKTVTTTDSKTKKTKSRIIQRIVTGTRYSNFIKDESGQNKGIDKIETTTETWDYDENGKREIKQNTKIPDAS